MPGEDARAAIALIAILCAPACRETITLGLPLSPETASVVLITEHLDGDAPLEVVSGTPESMLGRGRAFDGRIRLTLFLYDRPLEALFVPVGVVPAAESAEMGRALPAPIALEQRDLDDARSSWTAVDTPDDRVAMFRFRDELADPQKCALAGGCFLAPERICNHPCPEPPEPAPPLPPNPPRLSACPAGWSIRDVFTLNATVAGCTPVSGRICDTNEVPLLRSLECVALGPVCAGEWASDLPSDRTLVYVREGAAANGTGSLANPFGTIAEAIAGAPSGAIIALSRGNHAFTGTFVHPDLELWGACATESNISSAVEVEGGLLRIRHATLFAPVTVDASATLVMDGVRVVAGPTAIEVDERGALALSGSQVVADRPLATGIAARGTIAITDCGIDGFNKGIALRGATAEAEIIGTTLMASGQQDAGVGLTSADHAMVHASQIEIGAFEYGTVTTSATMNLEDVFILGARTTAIYADEHAAVTLHVGRISAAATAIHSHTGSNVVAEDLIASGLGAYGVLAEDGIVHLSRAFVDQYMAPLAAIGQSTLEVEDTTFQGSAGGGDTTGCFDNSSCRFERIIGIQEEDANITLSLHSSAVLRDAYLGGSRVVLRARFVDVEITRVELTTGRFSGLALNNDAQAEITDLRITSPLRADQLDPPGIQVSVASRIDLRNFLIDTRGAAIDIEHSLFATFELHRGRIRNARAGLVVHDEEFDFSRGLDRVVFTNVGMPFATE